MGLILGGGCLRVSCQDAHRQNDDIKWLVKKKWLVKVKESESEVAQSCPSLWLRGLQPTRLLCPWDFSGKNTGVGCCFLLQGIFPTQGSNPGLLCCRQMQADTLTSESPGKPKMVSRVVQFIYMCLCWLLIGVDHDLVICPPPFFLLLFLLLCYPPLLTIRHTHTHTHTHTFSLSY